MANLNRIINLLGANGVEASVIVSNMKAARPGRIGWQERVARATLKAHRAKEKEEEFARDLAEEARAKKEKEEKAAAKLAAEDIIAAENGGYVLRDVNPYYYNCGHYPEWVVAPGSAHEPAKFATRAEAQASAEGKNKKSSAAWRAFLDF